VRTRFWSAVGTTAPGHPTQAASPLNAASAAESPPEERCTWTDVPSMVRRVGSRLLAMTSP